MSRPQMLRIPDFSHFAKVIEEVYKVVEPNTSGANAQYIPQLAEVDPDQVSDSAHTVRQPERASALRRMQSS